MGLQHSLSPPSSSQFDLLLLGDPRCHDPMLAGSKAATLSRLFHVLAGAIPPGVVVPAPQADLFVNITGSDRHAKAVQALLAALGHRSPSSAKRYAVRSSALDEDSASHSFAGQYETTLGLDSEHDIIDAIEACVRSAASAQVAAYRRAAAVSGKVRAPAVLVQEMVPADRAGIAFTVNPVTGEDEVIINASYGLGDLVVSGKVTPDEIIVESSARPPRIRIGSKHIMSILTYSGITQTLVPESLQAVPSVSDAQISSIVTTARKCETLLGHPVDIEWALSGEKLFLLQARPVTTTSDRGHHD